MTRKCIMCNDTNNKNVNSFFSAPKDLETRKKWEDAIGIENYVVSEDTFVCSEHFHKDDIITHWVSGIPPHVIMIKYKKCRLKPGAVPIKQTKIQTKKQKGSRNQNFDDTGTNIYTSLQCEEAINQKQTAFLIPRIEEQLETNNDEDYKGISLHQQFSDNPNGFSHKRNSSIDAKFSGDGINLNSIYYSRSKVKQHPSQNLQQMKQNKTANLMEGSIIVDRCLMEGINCETEREKQSQELKKHSYSESPSKNYYIFEDKTMKWKHKRMKNKISSFNEKLADNNSKVMETMYIQNEIENNLSYNQLDTYDSKYDETDGNEMLFEDLLEVYTEILLPCGWSSLVTSKGHTTTIVYLYMGMTKSRMPFIEKQVFIKSDMMLRCSIVNKEINPVVHNLIREGKHLKVQSLMDIEELIDEFDQRTVCQGICDTEGCKDINRIKVAHKDGIKWRHISCPLLVNNDSSRCTKCISLSHMLKNLELAHNPSMFLKQQQKIYSIHQICKRKRKQDREYKHTKVFK